MLINHKLKSYQFLLFSLLSDVLSFQKIVSVLRGELKYIFFLAEQSSFSFTT